MNSHPDAHPDVHLDMEITMAAMLGNNERWTPQFTGRHCLLLPESSFVNIARIMAAEHPRSVCQKRYDTTTIGFNLMLS